MLEGDFNRIAHTVDRDAQRNVLDEPHNQGTHGQRNLAQTIFKLGSAHTARTQTPSARLKAYMHNTLVIQHVASKRVKLAKLAQHSYCKRKKLIH